MYDPTISNRFLAAQRKADAEFRAIRHSLSDVDAMIGVLAGAWDPNERRQTRKLSLEEIAFIENEQIVCTHDFDYFSTRYCWIIDYEKRLVRFTPNVAQRIVLDIWAEMEQQRFAIMMLQLKARQLGVSTLTELAVLHRFQFWSEVDAIVASSTPEKSSKMARMMRTAMGQMPWWLMPTPTSIKDGLPVEFRESHNTLDVSSGNKFSGVGRGSTPGVFHGSELCEWPNPEEDIDASLLNAVHETPDVFFVLESTALGRGNWFHRKWKHAKEHWGHRGSKLCPIFLPFYVGRDIYPDDGWLLKHPVPATWVVPDRIVALADRCAEEAHRNDRLRKYLGTHWVMPKEMCWWYFFTESEYRDTEELNRFRAECCSSDMEAFQSTNQSAFSQDVIEVIRDRRKEPVGVYKLVGRRGCEEDIPIQHRPTAGEEDRTQARIPIRCQWGNFDGSYELVPVKYQGESAGSPLGLVFIYEHPKRGYTYGYGCDTAEGIGGDRSVIEIVRKDTLSEPDVQACEFASDFVSGLELWPWCMALGTYYSPLTEDGQQQALSSIEVRFGGDALQYELRKRGWVNFLVWPRVLDSKHINLAKANKLGFVTNTWSRPNMVNILLTWINRERIIIHSPYFIEECEAFEKAEEGQKLKAAYGEHDDRIMALGFILFAFHIHEIHSDKVSLADQRESLNAQEDPEYDPGVQGRDVVGVPILGETRLNHIIDVYRKGLDRQGSGQELRRRGI